MHKNFAMMVLQTVSHMPAGACPPPRVNTTNELQPFGHRYWKKTTHPRRFAQIVEPVLSVAEPVAFLRAVVNSNSGGAFGRFPARISMHARLASRPLPGSLAAAPKVSA